MNCGITARGAHVAACRLSNQGGGYPTPYSLLLDACGVSFSAHSAPHPEHLLVEGNGGIVSIFPGGGRP